LTPAAQAVLKRRSLNLSPFFLLFIIEASRFCLQKTCVDNAKNDNKHFLFKKSGSGGYPLYIGKSQRLKN
jgi:hypothetical protein